MSFNHNTIEELHELLVNKEVSARELTQATLEDIKSREDVVDSLSQLQKKKLYNKQMPLIKKD